MRSEEERYFSSFDKFFARWSRREFIQKTGGALAFTAFMGGMGEFLSACFGSSTTGGPVSNAVTGGTLTEGSPIDITGNFNSVRVGFYSTDAFIPMMIYEGLVKLSPQGDLLPSLASDLPQISSDGTTYTFKIRKEAVWSDGKPVTADDVVFTYKLMYDPQYKDVISNHRPLLQPNLASVTAVDPNTVRFVTNGVWAPFLPNHARYGIMPSHIIGGFSNSDLNTSPYFDAPTVVGGPFKFVEWKKQDHVTLARNDKYYGQKPYIDTYIHKDIPQLTALVDQLKTGEVDCTRLFNPPVIPDLQAAGIKVVGVPSPQVAVLALQNDPTKGAATLFADPQVRKALLLSLDREGIVNAVFSNVGAKIQDTHWTPQYWCYDSSLNNKFKYDLSQAASLLDAAGWTKGSDGIRQKNGVRMKFTVPINIVWNDVANAAVAGWKTLGIDCATVQKSFAQSFQDFTFNHKFDVSFSFEIANPDPDISQLFTTPNVAPGGNNWSNYSNPQLDQLFTQSTATLDQSKRKTTYSQIESLMQDNMVAPALWQYVYFWTWNPRLHNGLDGPSPVVGPWTFNDPRDMNRIWVTKS